MPWHRAQQLMVGMQRAQFEPPRRLLALAHRSQGIGGIWHQRRWTSMATALDRAGGLCDECLALVESLFLVFSCFLFVLCVACVFVLLVLCLPRVSGAATLSALFACLEDPDECRDSLSLPQPLE